MTFPTGRENSYLSTGNPTSPNKVLIVWDKCFATSPPLSCIGRVWSTRCFCLIAVIFMSSRGTKSKSCLSNISVCVCVCVLGNTEMYTFYIIFRMYYLALIVQAISKGCCSCVDSSVCSTLNWILLLLNFTVLCTITVSINV